MARCHSLPIRTSAVKPPFLEAIPNSGFSASARAARVSSYSSGEACLEATTAAAVQAAPGVAAGRDSATIRSKWLRRGGEPDGRTVRDTRSKQQSSERTCVFNSRMSFDFVGPDPWGEITAAAQTPGPRYAAVAFLGPASPAMLPLKRGDTLVVNASDSAVRSRSTSPEAIAAYLEKGVLVYGEGELHAKVIATATKAVIGSANASARSRDRTIEAVVVSDSKAMVTKVQRFVGDLADEKKQLTKADLPRLRKLWDEGESNDPGRAVPGVNRDPEGLIEDFTAGFVLQQWTEDRSVDPGTETKVNRRLSRVPRDPHIGVDWFVLDDNDEGFAVGTVLFEIDDVGIEPPRVVTGPPTPLPDDSGKRYQAYRFVNSDAGNYAKWDELEGSIEPLRAIVEDDDWHVDRWCRPGAFADPDGIGEALLALWEIEIPAMGTVKATRRHLRRRQH